MYSEKKVMPSFKTCTGHLRHEIPISHRNILGRLRHFTTSFNVGWSMLFNICQFLNPGIQRLFTALEKK